MTFAPYNREYLTCFTGSSGYLLVTGDELAFFTDSRYRDQARAQISYEEDIKFEIIEHTASAIDTIRDWTQARKIQSVNIESDEVTVAQMATMANISAVAGPNLVKELRLIKDPSEIGAIQKAVDLCDQCFGYILGQIKPGISEREIALSMEFWLKKHGASGLAFDTIVASGWRSALPHGVASDKLIEKGDLITIDFGAVVDGYVSDITRTIVVGPANDQQKKIYNTVLTAQLMVIDNIRAGLTGAEIDKIARDHIYSQGYEGYFGHGLGHGIGKEVHEAPRLSPAATRPLERGMVVTDEPGIYLPDWGGVRIEDDLVITETGCRVLNRAAKDLIELDS